MNVSLLGSLEILSTTLLTKNLLDPDLNLQFFLDPKCLSKDLSTKACDFETSGRSNQLEVQFQTS